jgi:hypothetical protein
MPRPAPLCALLALCATAPLADGTSREVRADLDGDGRAETYRLEAGGEGAVDLVVEGPGAGLRVPGVAWEGPMAGQGASLERTPGGSVRVVSGNDAVGRDRWRLALTLAHRGGEIRVAGLTYEWRDTLDPEAWGLCDINLLTGRGTVETEAGPRAIAAPFAAPPLRDWREADHVPFDWCQ